MITRLQKFIESEGISVRSFEKSISASDGMIRRAIANKTDIQSKWLSIIAEKYPRLNVIWLLTGDGEMLKHSEPEQAYNVSGSEQNYCQNKQLTQLLELQKKHIELVEEMLNVHRAENERLKKELEAKNHNKTIPADVEYGRKMSEYFPQREKK